MTTPEAAAADADPDPSVPARHRDLEQIANAALRLGRLMMECGARVGVVREGIRLVSLGLGAESVGVRVGYASLAATTGVGSITITRMTEVGRHAVNHRLDLALRRYALEIRETGGTAAEVQAGLDRLVRETPHHSPMVIALATGLACAAFGRLLGMDWLGFLPVWVGGTVGQLGRHNLLRRGVNLHVMAAVVAFTAGSIGGWGAKLLGSGSVEMALMASTLLLVPGVPATNAQMDIMEGFPTVGSARAVVVAMIMVFSTTGIWCANALMRAFS